MRVGRPVRQSLDGGGMGRRGQMFRRQVIPEDREGESEESEIIFISNSAFYFTDDAFGLFHVRKSGNVHHMTLYSIFCQI